MSLALKKPESSLSARCDCFYGLSHMLHFATILKLPLFLKRIYVYFLSLLLFHPWKTVLIIMLWHKLQHKKDQVACFFFKSLLADLRAEEITDGVLEPSFSDICGDDRHGIDACGCSACFPCLLDFPMFTYITINTFSFSYNYML